MSKDEQLSTKQTPEQPIVELIPAPTHPPKINLHDAASIRREMSAVYRDMRSGKVEISDGTKLAYVLSQMGKMYELQVVEERLNALENQANES